MGQNAITISVYSRHGVYGERFFEAKNFILKFRHQFKLLIFIQTCQNFGSKVVNFLIPRAGIKGVEQVSYKDSLPAVCLSSESLKNYRF